MDINNDTIVDIMTKAINKYDEQKMIADVLFWGAIKNRVAMMVEDLNAKGK